MWALGRKFFPFRLHIDSCSELGAQGNKQEVIKIASLRQMVDSLPGLLKRLMVCSMACTMRKRAYKHAPIAQIQIILRSAKYHAGICYPFIHSVVFNDSASGHQRRMRRLIWTFAVCICQKTRFRMAQPNGIDHVQE